MATRAYAHSRPDVDPADWEPLEDHLLAVAALAERFASSFGAGPWGRLAGLWHDLGKYSVEFQAYLRLTTGDEHLEEDLAEDRAGTKRKVDHSTAGNASFRSLPLANMLLRWSSIDFEKRGI
jgi:CRISPR-associated endonuclease/helicase Cas3